MLIPELHALPHLRQLFKAFQSLAHQLLLPPQVQQIDLLSRKQVPQQGELIHALWHLELSLSPAT